MGFAKTTFNGVIKLLVFLKLKWALDHLKVKIKEVSTCNYIYSFLADDQCISHAYNPI